MRAFKNSMVKSAGIMRRNWIERKDSVLVKKEEEKWSSNISTMYFGVSAFVRLVVMNFDNLHVDLSECILVMPACLFG